MTEAQVASSRPGSGTMLGSPLHALPTWVFQEGAQGVEGQIQVSYYQGAINS